MDAREWMERAGVSVLNRIDPEAAHDLALKALAAGLAPAPGPVTSPRLATRVWGLDFPNPVGIAAGFDKNAVAVGPALASGVGFAEVGAVTPRAQTGNPRPRLFRLREDAAAINRFGFNNEGMDAIAERLARAPRTGVVALNLGANKDARDRAADYAAVLRRFAGLADLFTVNVSSPNTERLRELQGAEALARLLAGVLAARDEAAPGAPVLVKIAPDLSDAQLAELVAVCREAPVQGIVATNTTLDRTGLRSRHAGQVGGLSGRPLFRRSTEVLRAVARLAPGMPLIGVGGVSSGAEAYEKIRAGASLVQLYTALAYGGVGLGARIARELDAALERDGRASVAEAVGADL